jgi:RNA polymerase sigma-70 factor (ECF subfamily)
MGHGPPAISSKKFSELWVQALPRVRAYVRVMVRSVHDEEDIVQETAIATARDFERYDAERPFVEWVLGYARFRVLKHLSRHKRERVELLDGDVVDQLGDALTVDDSELNDWHDALKKCLAGLSPGARTLIDLRYTQELQANEIANVQDLSIASVYTRLSQIRGALRDCILRRLDAQGR